MSDRASLSGVEPSLEDFIELLAVEFDRPIEDVSARSRLDDDLGFDSAELMELLLVIESMGAVIDEEVFSEVREVGELHEYVVMNLRRQAGQ